MTMKTTFAASAILALAIAAGVQAQAPTPGGLSAAEIVQKAEQAGYSAIDDVEFDDGLWELDATAPDGRRVDLLMDPRTGEILDPRAAPALAAADIARMLEAQGYSNVHDIELDDGRYEVEAVNAAGQKVDLKLDPRDGRILSEQQDD
jgi:uncharacterized membrane protein YkoI